MKRKIKCPNCKKMTRLDYKPEHYEGFGPISGHGYNDEGSFSETGRTCEHCEKTFYTGVFWTKGDITKGVSYVK